MSDQRQHSYRVLRRRGFPAMEALRLLYGPQPVTISFEDMRCMDGAAGTYEWSTTTPLTFRAAK